MAANTPGMTNQEKLNFLVDALVNGGASMAGELSIESQIANTRLAAQTIQRTGPDGKVQAISALQELADANTRLIRIEATQAAQTEVMRQLAGGKGIDQASLNAAVDEAVKKAMTGLTGKVVFDTEAGK